MCISLKGAKINKLYGNSSVQKGADVNYSEHYAGVQF